MSLKVIPLTVCGFSVGVRLIIGDVRDLGRLKKDFLDMIFLPVNGILCGEKISCLV